MFYRFRAVHADGRLTHGRRQASSEHALAQRLARQGLTLLRARPCRPAGGPGRRELAELCFHLEQLLRAGVPLLDALFAVRDAQDHPRSRDALAMLADAVYDGARLSEAMAAQSGTFSPLLCGLVQAGEAAGELAPTLGRLADSLRRDDALHAQLRKSLLYPAFVLILVLAVAALMLVQVVPQLAGLLAATGESLPWSTQALLATSAALQSMGALLLLAGLVFAVVLACLAGHVPWLATLRDRLVLRLPLWGPLQRKMELARFTEALAMLSASGVPLLDALRVGEAVLGNQVLRVGVAMARARIASGSGLTDSFAASHILPPLALRMLRVGEGSGELARSLAQVSEGYQRDVRLAGERLLILLEPTLTVILGGLLLWMVSAVLGPVYAALSRLGGGA